MTRKHRSEYLFCNERGGGQMIKESVERVIKRIAKNAGLGDKRITPHVMRHTTATQAVKSGMSVENVQKLLGHSNISTTMIYAEIMQNDVQESHLRYIV